MAKLIDLTGQKFGKWTVIARAENTNDNRAQWLCQCECGNQKIVIGKSLRNGSSTSCGCGRGKKLNLLGKHFGELTVIAEAPNKENGRTAWLCQCNCGNQKIIGTKELQNGDTKSCGCLRDKIITINEIGNKYGKLTVLSKAENTKSKTEGTFWLCQCECGNTIITSGTNLRLGHTQSCGCMVSRGEALIKQILTDNNINFKCQYQFSNCLTENHNPCKFDFAIFENNELKCLIEYDGIQHFENSNFFGGLQQNQIRDKIKTNYCIKNNIPLVRIPYTDYENINIDYIKERIEEECIVATLLK